LSIGPGLVAGKSNRACRLGPAKDLSNNSFSKIQDRITMAFAMESEFNIASSPAGDARKSHGRDQPKKTFSWGGVSVTH
jgi:hypothetical protein